MSTPALPPTPIRGAAVSEGEAASSQPTAKDAGTTSDKDVNYGRWAWALFLLLDLVNDVNNMSGLDGHVYRYSYIMC